MMPRAAMTTVCGTGNTTRPRPVAGAARLWTADDRRDHEPAHARREDPRRRPRCVLISQPNPTGDSPMTTAKPPARYSAMESARAGDFATPELHHPSGHDPALRTGELRSPVAGDDRLCGRAPDGELEVAGLTGAAATGTLCSPAPRSRDHPIRGMCRNFRGANGLMPSAGIALK